MSLAVFFCCSDPKLGSFFCLKAHWNLDISICKEKSLFLYEPFYLKHNLLGWKAGQNKQWSIRCWLETIVCKDDIEIVCFGWIVVNNELINKQKKMKLNKHSQTQKGRNVIPSDQWPVNEVKNSGHHPRTHTPDTGKELCIYDGVWIILLVCSITCY